MNEFIFLERQWERDRDTLCRGMDNFLTFDQPVTVLMFCEGTRLTPAKFAAARLFAQQKGVPPFEHHLMPRARGFVCCVRHLNRGTSCSPDGTTTTSSNQMPAIYNVQIAFPASGPPPTFLSLLRGQAVRGDVFLHRIPMSSIASGTEEEFLMQLYRRKDDLMSYYALHDSFPSPATCETPPSPSPASCPPHCLVRRRECGHGLPPAGGPRAGTDGPLFRPHRTPGPRVCWIRVPGPQHARSHWLRLRVHRNDRECEQLQH